MKAGIIFKIDGRKAIVLKSDGSFVSVNTKVGWKVGETISVSDSPTKRVTPFFAMAACLAVIFLGSLGWNQLYTSPTAIISLDVNPSIELIVNRFNRIVSSTALNDESKEILGYINIKNAYYQEALANILSAGADNGYLTDEANVVLTVFASDPTLQSSLLTQLQGVVDSNISLYSDQITTEYHAVDESIINGAHGHGITAGKYLYLQELQVLAPERDISELTHHSIDEIKGEIEACKQEHSIEGGGSHNESHS